VILPTVSFLIIRIYDNFVIRHKACKFASNRPTIKATLCKGQSSYSSVKGLLIQRAYDYPCK